MSNNHINYRQAQLQDLDAINLVVENAVMNWPLAERVKRLSLNVLTYDATDFQYFTGYVAVSNDMILGFALWDANSPAALLHGLYVKPKMQSKGIGTQLMDLVIGAAKEHGKSSILVRAERVSCHYFERQGLNKIKDTSDNPYPYLYCKKIA